MRFSREILHIAIPAIISNITTPMLGLIDVAITGHIGAATYIGAIAVGGSIFNMLYWLFNFLRMGSSGLTAQALGAKNIKECNLILYRSIFTGLAVSILMLIFQYPLSILTLHLLGASDEVQALARTYFNICIWGAPAVLISYALSGWSLGMQNSKTPMWMAIITNVANIVISLILVFGIEMKIAGVAIGTMASQWLGAVCGLIIILRKYQPAIPPIRLILQRNKLLSFFKINTDIFIRTACLVAVTLSFTHAGAIQSENILAANTLLLQFFMLFSFFMDGFAFAGEALAGKFHGMKSNNNLNLLVRELMIIGIVASIIFSTIYTIFGDNILDLLSKDNDVIETATHYLPWAYIIPFFGFMAFVWDGIFVGLTMTRAMLIAMAVAVCVFFALYYLLYPMLTNDALWLAFNSYLLTRGTVQLITFRHRNN